jgi:hypothetical protein
MNSASIFSFSHLVCAGQHDLKALFGCSVLMGGCLRAPWGGALREPNWRFSIRLAAQPTRILSFFSIARRARSVKNITLLHHAWIRSLPDQRTPDFRDVLNQRGVQLLGVGSPMARPKRPLVPSQVSEVCSLKTDGYGEAPCTSAFCPAAWPMDEPLTTNSTRRFCCLPLTVSFEAIGLFGPKPCVVTED